MAKTFTVEVDQKMDATLEHLSKKLGTNKSEVLRMAIALMKIAEDESENGNKVTISDKDNKVVKILIGY